MTAKKPTRSKHSGGGRVTPKGTRPEGATSGGTHGERAFGSHRDAKPRFDPASNRQFSGHAGPNRTAHRGNR